MKSSIIFFLFFLGVPLHAASEIFTKYESCTPNVSSVLFNSLELSPEEFELAVFTDGRVQGTFQMINKNSLLESEFKLEFLFYSGKEHKRDQLLTNKKSRQFHLFPEETNLFNYSFNIAQEEAKNIRGHALIIHSKQYSGNIFTRFLTVNFLGICILIIVFLVVIKQVNAFLKKNKINKKYQKNNHRLLKDIIG